MSIRVLHDARLQAAAGAVTIAMTGPLVAISGVSSTTATVFRCAFALPMLGVMLMLRRRRVVVRDAPAARRRMAWHLLAGCFLGADMVLWTESIHSVGAGVSTVLVNIQVVVVPLIGLLAFGDRIPLRFGVVAPVLLAGVALAGGVVDTGAAGSSPLYGTVTGVLAGVAYAAYLVLLRRSGSAGDRVMGLVGINVAAGVTGLVAGLTTGTFDPAPEPRALAWLVLLAVTGQILGWLLIGNGLARLTPSAGSTILLIQPVAAVVMGVVLLGERPSAVQLVGCAVVLLAVGVVARPGGVRAAQRNRLAST
ncbi:DMT family transporter [Pseudonocardia phyllosphaerae]|uniref:DMT family transporter n=1 Tax=Pseudonocardia phyllosphaerae TaxID=3390502 RepID=UPI00397C3FE4